MTFDYDGITNIKVNYSLQSSIADGTYVRFVEPHDLTPPSPRYASSDLFTSNKASTKISFVSISLREHKLTLGLNSLINGGLIN